MPAYVSAISNNDKYRYTKQSNVCIYEYVAFDIRRLSPGGHHIVSYRSLWVFVNMAVNIRVCYYGIIFFFYFIYLKFFYSQLLA